MDATGFYLNPINASNQTYGCHGASTLEHLLVYWVGPLVATMLTVSLKQHLCEIGKSLYSSKEMEQSQCLNGYHSNLQENVLGNGIEDVPPQLVPAANTRVTGDNEELVPTRTTRAVANGDLSRESTLRKRSLAKYQDSLETDDVEAEYTDSLEQESDRSDLDVEQPKGYSDINDNSKSKVVDSHKDCDQEDESVSDNTDEDLDKTIEVNSMEFDFDKLKSENYIREDSGFETESNVCTPSSETDDSLHEKLFPGASSGNTEEVSVEDIGQTSDQSRSPSEEKSESRSEQKSGSAKKSNIPRLTPKPAETAAQTQSKAKSKIPMRKSWFWINVLVPLTHWTLEGYASIGLMIFVSIGSGNGLVPDGTKPSPEPMLFIKWFSQLKIF